MNELTINELATFAAQQNISPAVAHVLPALFENAAKKVGMSVRGLIAEATFNNNELGEHLADVARKVAGVK